MVPIFNAIGPTSQDSCRHPDSSTIAFDDDLSTGNLISPPSTPAQERYLFHVVSARATVDLSRYKQVPPYFAGGRASDKQHGGIGSWAVFVFSAGAPLMLGAAFGAVHFIAWSDEFRYPLERHLWRYSALIVTGLPVFLSLLFMLIPLINLCLGKERSVSDLPFSSAPFWVQCRRALFTLLFTFGGLVYILARIVLMVLPLMSLSFLPEAAFQTVEWTTFFPHI